MQCVTTSRKENIRLTTTPRLRQLGPRRPRCLFRAVVRRWPRAGGAQFTLKKTVSGAFALAWDPVSTVRGPLSYFG